MSETGQALGSDVALGDMPIGVQHFIKAGCHFGHQTKRWNPKMRPFIYGARNGIHIIDLDQTATLFKRAYNFVVEAVGRGGHVLFVGTKRQAQDIVQEEAARASQFFVNDRWLGGTLTNFRTIKTGIERLRTLERMVEDGTMEALPKKEALMLNREREKLEKFLGGIKAMNGVPAAIFVIDPHHEHIAIREGRKLNIPIVAITDTNCDPDLIDFVIPANDDAIRSVKLITSRLADACLEGIQRRREFRQEGGNQGGGRERGEREGGNVSVEFSRGNRRGGAGGGGQGGRPGQGGPGRGPRSSGPSNAPATASAAPAAAAATESEAPEASASAPDTTEQQ
ncbi:MAG: ribosomal protein S2p [Myxococcaceae bacterium]|nr:ribosomal protein S2p [Myxococcaceae bacterium]